MSEVALVGRAPARFGCEEPKARADDFAIEVGRQFGIVGREVMDRQGARQGRRGKVYVLRESGKWFWFSGLRSGSR